MHLLPTDCITGLVLKCSSNTKRQNKKFPSFNYEFTTATDCVLYVLYALVILTIQSCVEASCSLGSIIGG